MIVKIIMSALFFGSVVRGPKDSRELSVNEYAELMDKAHEQVAQFKEDGRRYERLNSQSLDCANQSRACLWQAERVGSSLLDASYYFAGYSQKVQGKGDRKLARKMAIYSYICMRDALKEGDEKAKAAWSNWRLNGGRGLPWMFVWSGPIARASKDGHDVHPAVFQGKDPDPSLLSDVSDEEIDGVDISVEREAIAAALRQDSEQLMTLSKELKNQRDELNDSYHNYQQFQHHLNDIGVACDRLQKLIDRVNENE